jgi:hypothetical protein
MSEAFVVSPSPRGFSGVSNFESDHLEPPATRLFHRAELTMLFAIVSEQLRNCYGYFETVSDIQKSFRWHQGVVIRLLEFSVLVNFLQSLSLQNIVTLLQFLF